MIEEKAEVTMSRAEYDALKEAASPGPAAEKRRVDDRGYRTVEGMDSSELDADAQYNDAVLKMRLKYKEKELEDQNLMRDAQRQMSWFSLIGMLLYPFAVVLASVGGLDQAQSTLGDMAPTYFVSVAGIVAAFFGAQAFTNKGK